MKPEMLAVKLDGTHDIAWRYAKGAPTMPSPLLVGEELYFVSDAGVITCLDAKTGTEHYKERLGGDYSSSPIFADSKIYIGSRTGLVTVIAPGKKFEALGKNQLPGKIMATPAAVDGALFIRTDEALFRIGSGAKP
jgi:outer membrane protein assembly factor BamB